MTMGAGKEHPKVVLVGPVFPFRGGIAQHTTFVARELEKICDLHTISFRRQFPKLLYPGASDRDPEAPDAGLNALEYSIDSINPLSWFRTVRRIRTLEPEIVIIPWWTFFLGPCLGTIARACRRAGIEVRIICHNADDHEAAWWKQAISRWILRSANAIVAQSRADRDFLKRIHPEVDVSAFAHPIHSQFPDPTEVLPRRAKVELLFFGLVRPYKGLDTLIAALPDLDGLDWHLSIVGEFWSGREATVHTIETLGVGDRVELVDSYVNDATAASYFSRADIVVLPYRKGTGSGVIPLAYRFGKPVIASHLGGLSDLVDDGFTGLLVAPEDPKRITDAVRKLIASDCDFAHHIDRKKSRMSWSRLASHLVSTFDPDISIKATGSAGDSD
jgi:glycosyltransferase involved in cell wall biosynthesis